VLFARLALGSGEKVPSSSETKPPWAVSAALPLIATGSFQAPADAAGWDADSLLPNLQTPRYRNLSGESASAVDLYRRVLQEPNPSLSKLRNKLAAVFRRILRT